MIVSTAVAAKCLVAQETAGREKGAVPDSWPCTMPEVQTQSALNWGARPGTGTASLAMRPLPFTPPQSRVLVFAKADKDCWVFAQMSPSQRGQAWTFDPESHTPDPPPLLAFLPAFVTARLPDT